MCSSPQLDPSSSQPPSPDLIAIAATLTQAARALLHAGQPAAGKPRRAEDRAGQATACPDEIRCYCFPPVAVECEQELLKAQGAENMLEVLFNASASLKTFGALLERIDEEAHLEGMTLHMLAQELQRVGHLLFKIQDAYSTVELVEA